MKTYAPRTSKNQKENIVQELYWSFSWLRPHTLKPIELDFFPLVVLLCFFLLVY